ncbi:hypothetical protein [Chryseolinea sp. H1M3-3]|uniref:hypothetical protein n=1 Tax=Chryseolinea sp. H1M3-3 TaxID=3034144 RepID=UPI0023ED2633|nr:hypothetical protein [Chryseolinea sp. H1M3-3]
MPDQNDNQHRPPYDFRRFVTETLDEKRVHPNSKTALELFKNCGVEAPTDLKSKVNLYEELNTLGLSNTSPLFAYLFETYGQNLPLR